MAVHASTHSSRCRAHEANTKQCNSGRTGKLKTLPTERGPDREGEIIEATNKIITNINLSRLEHIIRGKLASTRIYHS